MAEFWANSGWQLLEANDEGELQITADFLRAYFMRPEIMPEETSCDAELALHEAVTADPFRVIEDEKIAAIADDDVQHNYRVLMGFRDFLIEAGTLEAAYLKIARSETGANLPMLFVDQMVHAILRQILADVRDPIQLRAAELFFREQTVATDDGRIMLADGETIEMFADAGGLGGLGQLLTQTATPTRQVELDVLHEGNKADYWARSERFDTVVDFRFAQPPLDAFARVIEAWVEHFLKINVRVQPVQRIDDEQWRWHIGLDADATRVLNKLYKGEDAELDDQAQIIALFAMQIEDRAAVIESVRGRPVYLGLAMSQAGKLRMKPQNLLVNMPLEKAA